MAKEKKKGSLINAGVTIVKYAKYLANPIVLYILLGLIILLFLAGAIGFFMALPGSISGWISDQVAKVKNYKIMIYDVKDEEVKELAKQLEEMGYDIENYGFVDEIERENAIEGNTYLNNKPQKGAIKSVTSKYLTAYIGEEKKMYRIAPVNYSPASITEDYYLMEAIKDLGELNFFGWGGNSAIRIYFANIGDYDSLSEKDKLEYDNGKALVTYYFYYMKGTEVKKLDVEEQDLYLKGKGLAAEEATKGLIEKLSEKYDQSITTGEVRKIGVGMIVLKGQYEEKGFLGKLFSSSVEEAQEKEWGYFNVVQQFDDENIAKEMTFEYRLDPEKLFNSDEYKWFTEAWYKIMFMKMSYNHTVDLEEWAYKYGKPSELTIALHLATQAPDFVYKFATSTNTDTKVYVNQYLRKETYTVVTKNRGNEKLSDHIEGLLKSDAVVQSYAKRFGDIAYDNIDAQRQSLTNKTDDSGERIYSDGTIENILQEAKRAFDAWLSQKNAQSVEAIITAIDEGWSYKGDEIVVSAQVSQYGVEHTWFLIPIQGVMCSYFEADTILLGKILGKDDENPELGKDLEQTIYIPIPYIEKVTQHWYRNQYFVYDASGNKLKNAKQIATSFLSAIGEELTQNNPEINILTQIESANTEINNIAVDGSLVQFNVETEQQTEGEENQVYSVTVRLDVYRVIAKLQECYNNVIVQHLNEENKKHFDSLFYIARNNIIYNFGETYELVEYPTMWESLEDAGNPHQSSDNAEDPDYDEYLGNGFTDYDKTIDRNASSPNAIEVIKNSYWKIESTPELVQIHNPIFEDNSRSIRKWLKEKYVIYNGESKTKEERLQKGKSYIQAKTALDDLVAMLDKTSIADKYIQYLKRDVQEFAQDYAFDSYQETEVKAEKNLENIMPEYVPYTVWPSEYETAEEPWTKMIFKKNGSTNLVAPADCEITKDGSIYKIAIKDEAISKLNNISNQITGQETDSTIYEYVYLMADGNTNVDIKEGSYTQGDVIGTAYSGQINGVDLISIKMQMLSYTKQKIDISTRMNVKNRTIEDITEEELDIIENIFENAIMYDLSEKNNWSWTTGDTGETQQEWLALLNTVFNRIASPYCNDSSLNNINYSEMGIEKETYSIFFNHDWQELSYSSMIKRVISLALSGSDKTKEGTILGATRYYKLWKNGYDYGKIDVEQPELDLALEQQVTGGLFYITTKEYKQYQDYYINNKIRSIIMQLNEQKDELNEQKGYTAGYGKYEFESSGESIPIYDIYAGKIGELLTKKIKETIMVLGAISSGSAQGNSEQESIITSIIVTDVNEEISAFADSEDNLEEDEVEKTENGTLEPSTEDNIENQTFTDTFKIKVNANNSAYITITYQCEAEGKIKYDTLEYTVKEIPRL